ncbi:hypothetical protein RRG08_050186 [Elysia crispata]|uniref:G-protein coupled receptors family 1 profile domain-containing protein n=1 Tax=Elysia crispata TaxID=231223 RepID=A0AAE0Z6R7_9GAST|nr:hypothetical protein RRG08_050186 [Elysia crispata]
MDNSTTDFVPQGLISDATLASLSVLFKLIVNPALGIMGLCTNIINIVVFYKMGLADGVTQNFFILSISDCCLSSLSLTSSVAYILYSEVFDGLGGPEYQAQVVYGASILIGTFPQSVSLVTTVVIAVVRCCCVAIPLRVKLLMTARRQLAVILTFTSCSAVLLIYAFSPSRVIFVHNPLTNASFILIVDLKWYEYTVFSNLSSYIGFIIVITCVIILTISLNKASNFRDKTTGGPLTSVGEQTKDGSREARIIKTVMFVSIVFILCYIPAMVLTMIGTLVEEFSLDGIYSNANLLNLMVMEMFIVINATVNIFIYYFFNTRYRTIFHTTFKNKPSEN